LGGDKIETVPVRGQYVNFFHGDTFLSPFENLQDPLEGGAGFF
jgi:hypothetical protein